VSAGRTAILARIAAALAAPTDPHVRGAAHEAGAGAGAEGFRAFLPPVGEGAAERMRLFAEQAAALRVDLHAVADGEARDRLLRRLAGELGWRTVASHEGALTGEACASLGLPVVLAAPGYDRDALERCDVGITACEALIAQTGSVLVTSRSSGGRALTCLPPHHVVLARADQLLPDLTAGYALLRAAYGGDWPTFIGLITGPSRTGDIERILVLGAHGPKRLTVIVQAW
jgi:L-lactate dehydrogenase complex protein LldG